MELAFSERLLSPALGPSVYFQGALLEVALIRYDTV